MTACSSALGGVAAAWPGWADVAQAARAPEKAAMQASRCTAESRTIDVECVASVSSIVATLLFVQVPESDVESRVPRPEVEAGARVLLRPEARVNEEYAPSQADDSWRIRQGVRGYVHGFWGPASVRAELQHVYDWGGEDLSETGTQNRNGIFQGYLDLQGARGPASGFIRVGRQWFALGSERLIAYRYWQPGNQSVDALRMEGTLGKWTLGAFGSLVAPPRRFVIEDDSDPPVEQEIQTHGHLFGAAYLYVRPHRAANLEAYVFGWNEGATEAAPDRDRRLATYQLRVTGEPVDGLAYEAEGYYQVGSMDGREHLGWSLVGSLGYEFQRDGVRPGLGLLYEAHSGERCVNEPDDPEGCGAETSGDFNRLLGIGHRHRGHMDLVGPSNTRTLSVKTWLRPDDTFNIALDYHFFQLHRPDGKWMLNDGTPVGRGWDPQNTESNLGHEVDLELDYRPWKVLSVRPAYGIFVPDRAARRLAGTAPQHFVYVWLVAHIGHRW